MSWRARHAFSLLELSVVLIVVGLITAAGVTLSNGVLEASSRIKTQERLATIQYVIDNYAKTNGYLPCPFDPQLLPTSANFGVEKRTGNTCTAGGGMVSVGAFIGGVPTRTLGLPDAYAADAWGNKFTYAASTNHVGEVSSYGDRSTAASITLNIGGGSTTATYVVVSHGPTGVGSYPTYSATKGTCTAGTADTQNCDYTNATFADTFYNDGAVAAQFFDDFIVWSTNTINRSNATAPLAASSCPTSGGLPVCESWCAQCKTNIGAGGIGYAGFATGTPVLCSRIIVNTSPCEAVCIWAGKVGTTYLKCP